MCTGRIGCASGPPGCGHHGSTPCPAQETGKRKRVSRAMPLVVTGSARTIALVFQGPLGQADPPVADGVFGPAVTRPHEAGVIRDINLDHLRRICPESVGDQAASLGQNRVEIAGVVVIADEVAELGRRALASRHLVPVGQCSPADAVLKCARVRPVRGRFPVPDHEGETRPKKSSRPPRDAVADGAVPPHGEDKPLDDRPCLPFSPERSGRCLRGRRSCSGCAGSLARGTAVRVVPSD